MKSKSKPTAWAAASLLLTSSVSYAEADSAYEISGYVGGQSRYFVEHSEAQNSLVAQPELYWSDENNQHSFTLSLFARWDEQDSERSHFDIREALWLYVADEWELRAGIGKVFWGVTESNHLVDIINQTDGVESIDGEQKLGQPMIHGSFIYDWGVIDAFLLPGFRERTFPGIEGRLGGSVPINQEHAIYESGAEQHHLDWAIRYSHTLDMFDFGVSFFQGTNREPQLQPIVATDGSVSLRPFYDQISQLGLDVQATVEDWLWKLEVIGRDDSLNQFAAFTAGFEYTLVGVLDSDMDLGLLTEFSRDSRNEGTTSPAENDVFAGARLTFNDVQSTELLLGVSQSLEQSDSQLAFIEGSRRLGESVKLTVDARFFSSKDQQDLVYQFREDDYFSITLEYYF